jgi:hypothetical protein
MQLIFPKRRARRGKDGASSGLKLESFTTLRMGVDRHRPPPPEDSAGFSGSLVAVEEIVQEAVLGAGTTTK